MLSVSRPWSIAAYVRRPQAARSLCSGIKSELDRAMLTSPSATPIEEKELKLHILAMPQPYVHPFYRIWFTTVDPIVLFLTVLTCIFSPATILETVVPREVEPFNPVSHGGLLHQAAALYGFCGIIYGALLRVSPDPKVWRIVQAATLGVDISLLATLYNLLRLQGRTDMSTWYGGDWFNMLFTVWVALIRVGFLLGIGGESDKTQKVR
jgi:hypothetical protein